MVASYQRQRSQCPRLASLAARPASVKDPPVVKRTNYTTHPGRHAPDRAALGILAGATDVDSNTLTVVDNSAPAHGNVTVNRDGSFTYVPGPDFNGLDSFTANVSDGSGGYASATITIGVGGLPQRVGIRKRGFNRLGSCQVGLPDTQRVERRSAA